MCAACIISYIIRNKLKLLLTSFRKRLAQPKIFSSLVSRKLVSEAFASARHTEPLRLQFGASRSGCNVDDKLRQMTKSHALV